MIGQRNLAPERGPNVWTEGGLASSAAAKNRWLQGLGGAAIAVTGAALAAVGGSMLYRATRSERAGHDTAALDATPAPGATRDAVVRDIVADESAASFPASDAPSWTPTMGATTHKRAE